jgi:hypothetical protein
LPLTVSFTAGFCIVFALAIVGLILLLRVI